MSSIHYQKKVFVGVSGGVDSSVALALLKNQGYQVVGVFIRTWQPDWIECTWRDERRDAMRVCAHLDVPFVELDLEEEYKKGVADYMITEYKKGRTPNPDVMCNREVKFGGFLKWALSQGADYIATGHYVGIKKNTENNLFSLLRGNDTQKDQSYFLWTLTQDQLTHCLFPLGQYQKSQVRDLAKKFNLPTAIKKDSQGICFIGEIDMKEFLKHYIEIHPGKVLDSQSQIIGNHTGALFYTIGERHGFTIDAQHKGTHDTPYYVVSKDVQKNTITVSQNPETSEFLHNEINLCDVVDNQNIFKKDMSLYGQIRYRGQLHRMNICSYDRARKSMHILFCDTALSVAPGQSLVLYRDGKCLGGGIVV